MFKPPCTRPHWPRRLRIPRRLAFVCLLALCSRGISPAQPSSAERPTVVIVVGAPGEEEYARNFSQWAEMLKTAAGKAGAKEIVIGLETNTPAADRERLQQTLANEPKDGSAELWLVFFGHGTFDGKEAKFNLRSNDVAATELAAWLQPFRRPLAVINTASASAPFLAKLSATNRVVVTATRSGSEVNYARFGQYFSEAIADPEADLDKDGQTSLLEAFLMGSRRVREFYDFEGRLATEHALLDDNGDGRATPPDWFRGVRAVKSAKDGAPMDGLRAHQFHLVRSEAERQLSPEVRARRDAIELSVSKLRDQKRLLPEDVYYEKLEALLLDMARLYEQSGKPGKVD
jgi:hypothetical protein